MKKLFTLFVAVLLTASVFAQSPEKMSYQAVIRNSSDVLVTDTQVGMQISILQGTADGSPVYVETQTPTTNANGLVSIEIGTGTVVSGDFTTIDWSNGPYYIKTETDPAGSTNYTITGTSQLLSVPYALHAKTADNGITTAQADAITANSLKVGITTQQASDITTNNAKVGYTDALVSANADVVANTAKVGITTAQANEIAANTLKVGITTSQATKLEGIATGAEVNVNADWSATTGDAQILNKPTTIAGYGITDAIAITGNQTISGNKTFTGTTTVATPVNATDATTKAYVDALLAKIEALEESDVLNNGFTDSRDGNHYNVIKIGNQIWMAEDLAYLPSVVGPGTGSNTTPYHYVYGYNGTSVSDAKATSNYQNYGVLYNWPAAMNACSTGWHLPTDAEWKTLEMHLGMSQAEADGTDWRGTDEGGKLKETGTTHWYSPNEGATNESGFTALPGGYRYTSGNFYRIVYSGTWWSATEGSTSTAWTRNVHYETSSVYRYDYLKELGFSVRCIRD